MWLGCTQKYLPILNVTMTFLLKMADILLLWSTRSLAEYHWHIGSDVKTGFTQVKPVSRVWERNALVMLRWPNGDGRASQELLKYSVVIRSRWGSQIVKLCNCAGIFLELQVHYAWEIRSPCLSVFYQFNIIAKSVCYLQTTSNKI